MVPTGRYGTSNPNVIPDAVDSSAPKMSMASGLSELMRRDQLSIEDMVRLVRGESPHDTRTNKAISAETIGRLY